MRTVEEFRSRQIEMLPHALERPGMYCGSGESADLFFSTLLSDLCWIDQRESEFDAIHRHLLHGSRRVYGQLHFQHLAIPDHLCNEIASTYAQAAYHLGYYQPVGILSERAFKEMLNCIDQKFFCTDHTETVLTYQRPDLTLVPGSTM